MSALYLSILAGLAIVAVSAAGAFFTFCNLNRFIQRHLSLLVSYSSGVFIVLSVALIIESYEMIGNASLVALCAAGGAGLLWLLSFAFPESHHHHEEDEPEAGGHSKLNAKRMLFGDAIHNIGDGLILVPAFMIDVHIGILTTVGIVIHETAQEISEFFVLRAAGYSIRGALLRNALVACTIFIGIGIGAVTASSELLIGIILGAAAGSFAFVIVKDLVPHSVSEAQADRAPGRYLLAAFLGIATMTAIQLLTPHTHIHEEEYDGTQMAIEQG